MRQPPSRSRFHRVRRFAIDHVFTTPGVVYFALAAPGMLDGGEIS